MIDDGIFDVLDRYRWVGDAQYTRAFAWGGAGAAGELGEIVGFVEPF